MRRSKQSNRKRMGRRSVKKQKRLQELQGLEEETLDNIVASTKVFKANSLSSRKQRATIGGAMERFGRGKAVGKVSNILEKEEVRQHKQVGRLAEMKQFIPTEEQQRNAFDGEAYKQKVTFFYGSKKSIVPKYQLLMGTSQSRVQGEKSNACL